MRLDGKIAIVTGGASGFGRGIAEAFAREGATVMIADRDTKGAAAVAAGIGKAAVPFTCDVSVKADVDAMVSACAQTFGGLDIIVNNAGITHKNQSLMTVAEDDFDRIYAVNVKSIYLTTLAGVPELEKRGGGSIIITASTAGVRPRPGLTWYNGSKGAALTLTKSMAAELAAKNIRVNAINPVIGETGLIEQFGGLLYIVQRLYRSARCLFQDRTVEKWGRVHGIELLCHVQFVHGFVVAFFFIIGFS